MLQGIESRLDHFVDIGIRAVWISPIYKSPMKDFGYDISNFTDIEPVFGNMTSFRSLSDAMKARGMHAEIQKYTTSVPCFMFTN